MEMTSTTRIAFMWSRPTAYLETLLRELINSYDVEILLICDMTQATLPHTIGTYASLSLVPAEEHDHQDFKRLLSNFDPHLVVVSGWMNPHYLRASRAYRRTDRRCRFILASDNQWRGSLRQHIGTRLLRSGYRIPQRFDGIWVPGASQTSYALRLGFPLKDTLFGLYTADTEVLQRMAARTASEGFRFNRRFVFAGRFEPEKNLLSLVEAYASLEPAEHHGWQLTLIGDGSLRPVLARRNVRGLNIMEPMRNRDLMQELALGGVGCLVSNREPWGVVLHEYVAAGMPLVASTACGAAGTFAINGYNAKLLDEANTASIASALNAFIHSTEPALQEMSTRSTELSNRLNPEISAAIIMGLTR